MVSRVNDDLLNQVPRTPALRSSFLSVLLPIIVVAASSSSLFLIERIRTALVSVDNGPTPHKGTSVCSLFTARFSIQLPIV